MRLTVMAFRNVMRNKRRSLLSGIAITISVMTIIIMYGLINGFMDDYKYNIQDFITGDVRIRNELYDKEEYNNPIQLNVKGVSELMQELDQVQEVKAAAPRIQFGTAIYGSPLLCQEDIADYPGFIKYLNVREDLFSRELMKNAPDPLKAELAQYAGKTGNDNPEISGAFKAMLLDYLNIPLQRRLNPANLGVDENRLSQQTKQWGEVLAAREADTWYNRLALKAYLPYYNRGLFEDMLPEYIRKTTRTGNTFMGLGLGVDFDREKDFINFSNYPLQGSLPADGRQAKEILLAAGLAAELQLTVGDRMTIYTKTSERMSMDQEEFRITGIITMSVGMFNKKFFFIPIDTAQAFLRMENAATDILVYAKKPGSSNRAAAALNDLLTARHSARLAAADSAEAALAIGQEKSTALPWTKIGMYSALYNMANTAYLFIGFFFFALASTVIVVTTMMVIFERMREIGTMAALGMKGNEIVRLFFLEAFYIAAAAALAGVIIGLGITIPMSITGLNFGSMMQGIDFEIAFRIYPHIDFTGIVLIFIYAVVIASLASVIPSRRAAGIQPVEALRTI